MEDKKIKLALDECERRISALEKQMKKSKGVKEFTQVDEEFFINNDSVMKSIKVYSRKRTGISLRVIISHPDKELFEVTAIYKNETQFKIVDVDIDGVIPLTVDAGWSDIILIISDFSYKYSYFTRLETRVSGEIEEVALNSEIDFIGDSYFSYIEGDTYKCIDSSDMRTVFAISGNNHVTSAYDNDGIAVLRKTCEGKQILEWYDPKSGEFMQSVDFKESYTDSCMCYDGDYLSVFFIRDNRIFYATLVDGEMKSVEQLPIRAKRVGYSIGSENQFLYYVDLSDNVNVIITNRPENAVYGERYSVGKLENVKAVNMGKHPFVTYKNGMVVYRKSIMNQSYEEIIAVGDECIRTVYGKDIVRKGKEIFKI